MSRAALLLGLAACGGSAPTAPADAPSVFIAFNTDFQPYKSWLHFHSDGPPDDGDSPDAALGLWAGELPLVSTWQQPVPDPALPPGVAGPEHVARRPGTRAYPMG